MHSAGASLGEHMVTKALIDRIATRIKRWRRNPTVSSTSGVIAVRLKAKGLTTDAAGWKSGSHNEHLSDEDRESAVESERAVVSADPNI